MCVFFLSLHVGEKKEKQNPTQIAPQGAINYLLRLYESLNPLMLHNILEIVHTSIYRFFGVWPF